MIPSHTPTILPHSEPAERNALVSIIRNEDRDMLLSLTPEHFFDAKYQQMYGHLCCALKKTGKVDFLAFCEFAGTNDVLMMKLINEAPHVAKESILRILQEKKGFRDCIVMGKELMEMGCDQKVSARRVEEITSHLSSIFPLPTEHAGEPC